MEKKVRILSRPKTCGREVTATWLKKLSPTPCRHLNYGYLRRWTWKTGNHFDRTDNVAIEFRELVSRNPKLLMKRTTNRVNGISLYEISINLEAGYITSAVVLRVPIAGDLQSVFLVCNGIDMGCSGKRGGNSFHPDASINASSLGPTGRYKVCVFILYFAEPPEQCRLTAISLGDGVRL